MSSRRLLAVLAAAALAPVWGFGTQAGAVGYPQPSVVSTNPVDATPHVLNGTVRAVAAVGARVYVGGTFTTVVNAGTSTQLPRSYLFAFDRATGRIISTYTPAVNGAVESIAPAPDGTSVIIGGRFTTVNGSAQRSLAMLDVNGARVSGFAAGTNGYVTKVLTRGSRLVVGGRFSTANGVSRSNLAVVNVP